MAQANPAGIRVTALHQVGIVVKNLEETMENYWNKLGIGPWIVIVQEPPQAFDMTYHGKPCECTFKVGLAQVGPVELELMQTLEGPTTYGDFLAEHGEGAHHLQYLLDSVEEIDKHVEILAKKGFPSVGGGRFGNNGGWNYIDTTSTLGTIWEPVKMADEFSGRSYRYPADESAVSPAKVRVEAIAQISLFVRDVEKTIENYQNIVGIGPWEVFDVKPHMLHDLTFRGKPGNFTMKVGLTKVGPVELELIQPTSGDSVYSDFIAQHGEGISHLAFTVDDVEKINKLMEEEGFSLLQGGRRYDGIGSDYWSYYDTVGPLKVIWEAWQPPQ